jgi:hypothetical protein
MGETDEQRGSKCRGGLAHSSRLKEMGIDHDMRPFSFLFNIFAPLSAE